MIGKLDPFFQIIIARRLMKGRDRPVSAGGAGSEVRTPEAREENFPTATIIR